MKVGDLLDAFVPNDFADGACYSAELFMGEAIARFEPSCGGAAYKRVNLDAFSEWEDAEVLGFSFSGKTIGIIPLYEKRDA